MLTLTQSAEPIWLDVAEGARLQLRPVSTVALIVARRAAAEAMADAFKTDDPHGPDLAGVALTVALARRGVVGWEGIADDQGAPLPVTPENIEALLRQEFSVYDAVDRLYVGPALTGESEKNGLSPSPNGTSTGVGLTAKSARQPAKRVRTKKTDRKPTKA